MDFVIVFLAGILSVLMIVAGIYYLVVPNAGSPKKRCLRCGHEGRTKRELDGSGLIELVLWCTFLFPGLLYSLWRLSTKRYVCAECGNKTDLVPIKSKAAA
jgi:DNA-directed RNA polymerase subunit RPC12/RpoP